MAPPPAADHRRNLILHAEEDALEIDVDETAPGHLFFVGDRKSAGADAGIVERHMEPPVSRERTLDHAAAIGFATDVGADRQRLATSLANRRYGRLRLVLVLIDDHDSAALGGKQLRRRPGRCPSRRPSRECRVQQSVRSWPHLHPAR